MEKKKCYIPRNNCENQEVIDIYEALYDEEVLYSIRGSILSDPKLTSVKFAGFSKSDLEFFYNQYGRDKVVGVFKSYFDTEEGKRYCGTILKDNVHPVYMLVEQAINGDVESLYELYSMAKKSIERLNLLKEQNKNIMDSINEFSEKDADSIVKRVSNNNIEIGLIESNPITNLYQLLFDSISISYLESIEYSKLCSDPSYSDICKVLINKK